MKCPSCGAGLAEGVVRCEFCREPIALAGSASSRRKVPRPEKLSVDDEGRALVITWRWFHPAVFVLIPFAVAWNAFLVGWYSMASGFGSFPDHMPSMMKFLFLVFPMAHVAVGLALIYGIAAMLLNVTTIRVDADELTVHHGPVYWPGCQVPVADIDQIYCSETTHKSEDEKSLVYNLKVLLKDGGSRSLLANLTDREKVLYLEQTLEDRLKIADRPVAGELSRG
jgi:hypothetical protein